VVVPAEGRAALLVFLMAGQPQSQKALEQVTAAVGAKPAVDIVLVVSGQQPDAAAALLKGKLVARIVVDPDYTLAGKMSVRAWPTTLVLMPDGEELAHMAGLGKAFDKDLTSYLEFTAGKIDRPTLKARVSSSQVVEDDSHQMARRHLEVAEREMAKGLLPEARKEMDLALKLDPASADLQLANARLLLIQGQPEQAMGVLSKIDASAVAPWKVDTLRGRALVALKQYDEALTVLTRAVRLNPEPGEAWYAMGLLYEQRGDWTQAARAYRSAYESTPSGRLMKAPETPAPVVPVPTPTPAKP
jgi:tetratricopeptide (TPR) repeat protein